MDIKDLQKDDIPVEEIVNPNLPKQEELVNPNLSRPMPGQGGPKKTLSTKELADSLGLKSSKELAAEDPNNLTEIDKFENSLDKAIDRKIEEVAKFNEELDSLEDRDDEEEKEYLNELQEEVVQELVAHDREMASMLENPPHPGVLTEEERLQRQAVIDARKAKEQEAQGGDDKVININDIKTETKEADIKDRSMDDDMLDDFIPTDPDAELAELLGEEEMDVMDEIVEETVEEEVENEEEAEVEEVVEEAKEEDEPIDLGSGFKVPEIPKSKSGTERDEIQELEALENGTEEESEAEKIQEARLAKIAEEVKEKIVKPKKVVDFNKFKIGKAVTLNGSIQHSESKPKKQGDWALPGTGRSITLSEFGGDDIELLLKDNGRNRVQSVKQQYQVIYDHIVGDKPADVEAWTKTVSLGDIDHLFAAIYVATFEGFNYIPYDCDNTKCNNSFLSDEISFVDSMVKFKTAAGKKRFFEIRNNTDVIDFTKMDTKLEQISDNYVFEFKCPSIYDVVFRSAYLDDDFTNRYNDIIGLASFIKNIYAIAGGELHPIQMKEFANSIAKTEKTKILSISKIVKTLSSDEYNMLTAYVEDILGEDREETKVEYILPETECPKCGRKISEATMSASQLLFLRHRLVALANSNG